MKILITYILSLIFLFLALIHIYWAFGGKGGSAATVPTKADNKLIIKPGLFDCLFVAMALLSFGAFFLIKSGIILFGLPGWLFHYGLWAIAALFLLRAIGEFRYFGFFKKIKTTKFGKMDTKYYSPLCFVIGVLAIILEIIS
ncbi:MAG TPA: DUF3995 domain-containing protein [Mucilaginibacter sp.]